MDTNALLRHLETGGCDQRLTRLYGDENLAAARARTAAAVEAFLIRFGLRAETLLLSAPGRTEVGGNHTDHNGGRVLAAAVGLDLLAVVSPEQDRVAHIVSQGFADYTVDLADLACRPAEENTSEALVRGIAARLTELGHTVGGFSAYLTSQIPKGSGLSSSAAFEVLVCNIFSHLYNDGKIDAKQAAIIGQWAENNYFGKPSGLMDQMASSVGGAVAIDFLDRERPVVEQIPFDVAAAGYALCIVDTHGSHDDLTPDYAAIPVEMRAVAAELGATRLADAKEEDFWEKAALLRSRCGDRALLRAAHFFAENRRVVEQAAALQAGEFEAFLALVRESGRSSWTLLQNVQSMAHTPREQSLPVALCLTERLLAGEGACRVHGGGFAGTIQAYVPRHRLESYRQAIDGLLGPQSCHVLTVRPEGGARLA